MTLRSVVCVIVCLAAVLPGQPVVASDGGLAFAEGCAVEVGEGFNFGPVVAKPFVRAVAAQTLFEQLGELYAIVADHPYGNGEFYFSLVYGSPPVPIETAEGVFWLRDIEAMTTLERSQLAQAFFEFEGVWPEAVAFLDDYARLADRRAFDELASYCEWRKAVITYDGDATVSGALGYWEDVVAGNPNAASYHDALTDSGVSRVGLPQLLTSTWAFLAVAGIQPHVSLPVPIETNGYDPVQIANRFPS